MATYLARAYQALDGSSNIVQVPFPYLQRSNVSVSIDGTTLPASSLSWTTDGNIQLPQAASAYAGKTALVMRTTPSGTPLASFTNSGLDVTDLNGNANQALYLLQELADRASELVVDLAGEATTRAAADAAEVAAREQAISDLANALNPGTYASILRSIDPRAFGAKFNGIVNDTLAFVAAASFAASVGLAVEMPVGTTVLSPITLPAPLIGAGRGRSTVKADRTASFPDGGTFLNITAPGVYRGFTVDVDDPKFNKTNAVSAVNVSGDLVVADIGYTGQPYFGVCVNGVTGRCMVADIVGNSTSMSSTIGLGVYNVSDGEVRGCSMKGSFGSHVIAVAHSRNVRCFSNNLKLVTSGAFGISFESNIGCQMWGNECFNSGPEAFQMTLCTDCTIEHSYAEWDAATGHDFGSSFESCTRCSISFNHFVNSYKGAVGVAADDGPSDGNTIRGNHATNCATRANAAGSSAGYIDKAVFVAYTNSATPANYLTNTLFEGNVIITTQGNSVSYGFLEAPASGPTMAGTKVRGTTFIGAGSVSVPYNIGQAGSYVWMENWADWLPTITTTGGASITVSNLVARYVQDGPSIRLRVQFTVAAVGSSPGSIRVTLPAGVYSAKQATSFATGREASATGKALVGSINPSFMDILFVDNTSPAVSGYNIAVAGSYELP